MLENEVSKRSTIIGTPHWMAPELVLHLGSDTKSVQYGTEIDCWAFGCAVYEMATGHPPNSRVRPDALGALLNDETPRLEGDGYSTELQHFVAFCLEEHPEQRPSATQIISHAYVANTTQTFPTDSIRTLISNYAVWEQSGGQRASLFNPYGAQAPSPHSPLDDPGEEWNFSTTREFDHRLSMGLDPFKGSKAKTSRELTAYEKAFAEASANRGGAGMQGIFNLDEKPYKLGEPEKRMEPERRISDLPLRNLDNGPTAAAHRTTLIDLDAVMTGYEVPNLDLADVPTIRAKKFLQLVDDDEDDEEDDETLYTFSNNNRRSNRKTQDWKFPQMADANSNRRTQDWTFPSMSVTDTDAAALTADANNQTSRKVSKESDTIRDRRTQDWKFPTTEEFNAITQDMPSPQLGLVHAKTMPVHDFYDYPHSVASSPDRTSMIDLDHALQVHIPEPRRRPSTADSGADSAVTDMTSGDPFDLEDQIQLSQTNNRGSLHMKSQSEPTAAIPASKQEGDEENELGSGLNGAHNRSSSMTRSDRERSSSRPRGLSARYRQRRPTALQRRWEGSDVESNNTMHWDPFSDTEEDMLGEEQRGWEDRLVGAQNRGQNGSNESSKAGQDHETAGGTLRPQKNAGGRMGQSQVQMPRQPNMAVLLHGTDPRLAAEELSGMYEDLAVQAEFLHRLLSDMGPLGDDYSDAEEYDENDDA